METWNAVNETLHLLSAPKNASRLCASVAQLDAGNGKEHELTALETMVLQDIFDAAVEPFDHAVCLRSHRGCETVLDVEIGAKLIELMLPVTTR